jgi:flavin reductase (DIM6/NTAB) family NADH-FMN oxidoreductase RutF
MTSVDPLGAGRLALKANSAMVIVTAGDRHGASGGCLVGFHSQASIDPWRHVVFLSTANHTYRLARSGTYLAVHVLGLTTGEPLARLFGSLTDDDGVDKFSRCAWNRSAFGPPILTDVPAWFVGRIIDRFPTGDHEGFLLEPVESVIPACLPDLLHHLDVRHLEAGHAADD